MNLSPTPQKNPCLKNLHQHIVNVNVTFEKRLEIRYLGKVGSLTMETPHPTHPPF